jgi:hypothetical protein
MWFLIGGIVSATVLVLGGVAAFTYLRYRGARFVKCPDNRKIEAVTLDAGKAAFCAAIGNPQLELRECTRWPEMKDCGQECLRQIEYGPDACLVRNVVAHWYKGRRCAICGDAFGEIHWHDHAPALLDRNGQTVPWRDVPLEHLTAYMESHDPVCWNCHIVQSFRLEHPELITYRKER